MIDVNRIKSEFKKTIDRFNDSQKKDLINKWNNCIEQLISKFKNAKNDEFEILDNKSYSIRHKEYNGINDSDKIDISSLGNGLTQVDIGVIIEMLQKVTFEKNYYFNNELIRNNYKYIYNKKLIKYADEIIKDLESLKWL